jgi:hypothetical protein
VTVAEDLAKSLRTTPTLPRDAVTVALAHRYAATLDACFDALTGWQAEEDPATHARVILEITRIGARLEATLDRLGMSPGARPATRGAEGMTGDDPARDSLDTLRRDADAGAPASGVDYAAAVDPAVAEALAED